MRDFFWGRAPVRILSLLICAAALVACTREPVVVPGEPTAEQRVAPRPDPVDWRRVLPRQLELVRRAAGQWRDFERAQSAGWKAFGGEGPLTGQYYYHPDGPDYVSGDTLDFSRPNSLIYAAIDGQRILVGVAFAVRIAAGDAVPPGFAGPQDIWHVHDFLGAIDAVTADRPFRRPVANRWLQDVFVSRGDARYRLAMVHVWTRFDNPDGVFAGHDRSLPYRQLGLPVTWSDGVSLETARGVAIATQGGCDNTLGGHAWIANLSREQMRLLGTGCRRSAGRVRAAATRGKAVLNRAARIAWLEYQAAYHMVLTPDQKGRIAAMIEHGHD